MSPGSLLIRIEDTRTVIEQVGGATHVLPVGTLTLVDGPLERADPPPPAHLTNALGLVHDHLDDLIIEAPSIAAATSIVMTGPHAESLACVEIGIDTCPARYDLTRAATDEVFRTLASEPNDDRRHNPGLPDDHVDTIVATCCIVLSIVRRLDRSGVIVERDQATEDID